MLDGGYGDDDKAVFSGNQADYTVLLPSVTLVDYTVSDVAYVASLVEVSPGVDRSRRPAL